MKRPAVTFAYLYSPEGISFGIMVLSAVLKKKGFPVRLIQARTPGEFIRRYAENPSEIVAFSITSGLHRYYLGWARRIKALGAAHTVFGGPHPTYFPDFIAENGVDALCMGEGEESFPEYLEAFMEDGGPPRRPVAGWKHRRGGEILDGGLRAPVADLDALPSPDWGLFFESNPLLARHHVKSFLATRGCPYNCTYCFNREWNARYRGRSKVVRVRDPELVVEEIDRLRRSSGVRIVWFLDANLACNVKWLRSFLPVYKRKVGLPFFCKVRPNVVSDELAGRLVDAGMTSVGIGIESGNDGMRNEVLERGISRDQILEACRAFGSRGVLIMAFNMLGLPGETYDMAKETLALNVEGKVDYAMTMLLQPFPGTEIARRAAAMGLFDGNFDELSSSYFSPSPIRFSSPREKRRIVNLQRLFALSVAFPEVRRHIDRLVELPENRFYLHLFKTFNHRAFHHRFYRAYATRPVF
jgi:anaerobic magnesium-protoporphyrin IX monomethyl ester cyclase